MTARPPDSAGGLLYGSTVLEHFRRPRNARRLDHPSVAEEMFNPLCGDRVRIELLMERDVVRSAAFTANACAVCTASASLLTEQVSGMSARDALLLTEEAVLASLGAPLPPARLACATLPLKALRAALRHLSPEP